jgi:hypothetical protein
MRVSRLSPFLALLAAFQLAACKHHSTKSGSAAAAVSAARKAAAPAKKGAGPAERGADERSRAADLADAKKLAAAVIKKL